LPAADSELEAVRRQVEEGLRARSQGDLVTARRLLARAVGVGLPVAEEAAVRAALVDIARQTILSPAHFDGDPLTDIHVVQAGEVLARIARSYNVTADLLALINDIPDKNRIGLGQRLKVVHGPFHAVIIKKQHQCRVFLDDVLVAEFPVGLGEYGSTPTGEWVASDKLTNPTYYPPASRGGDIIAADDPDNPLGEHWIGLKGVSGQAVGQVGYGIHGTIEPETVGKDVSMGCVRLLAEDVALLYKLMTPGESKVFIE
jgi:lipoprotein-anchoring transpeptidase ErfK/SrfK